METRSAFFASTRPARAHSRYGKCHAVNDGAPVKCLDRVESREIEAGVAIWCWN